MDLTSINKVLSLKCGLSIEKPVLVGVSGGPDSLCLLHILYKLNYRVIAVHVNHQLRAEASQEAEFVESFCASLKIPFICHQVDVKAFAVENKLSIEESARILRYTRLMQSAAEVSAQALAVAHQADDQVETVLMHLLRGAGSSGLKAMTYRAFIPAFSEKIPVVRPLLGVWREEILDYCNDNGISPCYDQSNTDQKYFRNRIRHELIPTLKTFNKQASQHLWQLAQIVGAEDNYLQVLAEQEFEQIVQKKNSGFVTLDCQKFQLLDVVMQRRVARLILVNLRSNLRDIGFDAVERMLTSLNSRGIHGAPQILDDVHMMSLGQNQVLVCTNQANFEALWPSVANPVMVNIYQSGEIRLNPHWNMRISLQNRNETTLEKDGNHAYFDFDLLEEPLTLSPRRTSERFKPFGMNGLEMKVGDYFTAMHYPERARRNWPILRMQNQILWVVGLRRSTLAPVSEGTKRILVFELIQTG